LMLDITKATTELNWTPKLNSKQAIEWTMDWYKKSIHGSDAIELVKQNIEFYENA